MVETITPVVHGGRGRWGGALLLHTLGAGVAATLFGSALGWSGLLLGAPFGRTGLLAIVAVAVAFAIGSVSRVRVPIPHLRRQVPDWWRTFYSWPVAAFLYGAGLGVGFFTFLAHGTLVAVAAAAALSGNPVVGALVFAPFGLARGLSASVAIGVRTPERGRDLVNRLAGSSDGVRGAANGGVLLGVALAAAVAAAKATSSGETDLVRLAGAVIAAGFAWAAAAKLLGMPRWRRALASHGLPHRAEPVVAWAVPLAELLVSILVIFGLGRTASLLALALLLAFTVESLRMWRRVGTRIPCGCFGNRFNLDVRIALLRNSGWAATAAVAALAADAPLVSWQGPQSAGGSLPSVVASSGLLVAALTGWRASVWLGRGRRA